MAKSSKNSEHPNLKVVVEKATDEAYNYIKVRSLYDAHLRYEGKVSGRQYEWIRAGVVVDVISDDVPELLSKRIGQRSCCGEGLLGNIVFEEVK